MMRLVLGHNKHPEPIFLKLMTLLSRGDFFDANGNHSPDFFDASGNHSPDFFDASGENSPLERGAERSEAGCVSQPSSKQYLENVTALPFEGEATLREPD